MPITCQPYSVNGLTPDDQSLLDATPHPFATKYIPPALTDEGKMYVRLPQRTQRVVERVVDGGELEDALKELVGQVVQLRQRTHQAMMST